MIGHRAPSVVAKAFCTVAAFHEWEYPLRAATEESLEIEATSPELPLPPRALEPSPEGTLGDASSSGGASLWEVRSPEMEKLELKPRRLLLSLECTY